MHLTKSERIYKKKLFRFIRVNRKSKQKKINATIVKTDLYRNGGYKAVYNAVKFNVFKQLTNTFINLSNTVKELAKSLSHIVISFNRYKNDEETI